MPEIASAKLSIDPELLPLGQHTRVLDVGCGDGRHLRAASRRGCRAIGIDYDPAELRRASENATHADLIAADASHLPFRDGAFNTVICTETLEHLPDDRGAMREIARVMRDDALLLGAVPSHFTEIPYVRLSQGYRDAPGGHVRIYAPQVLFRRLNDADLRVTSFRYVHFIDSLIWLRFCIRDALAPPRPTDDFEAAVLLAIAQERHIARWRREFRRALGQSWFLNGLERVGALVWPKSLTFVARKRVR
jgi:SAM-dependent methyltransferase